MSEPGGWPGLAVTLVTLVLATGCGDDRGLVPVTGKVTLNGASLPGAGDLTFVPVEVAEGFPKRPAKAEFAADGSYEAQSFKPGDGLFPGTYRVGVSCWKVAPTPDGPPPVSHIDTRYNAAFSSGLTVEVPLGSSGVEYNIDVKSPSG